MKKSCVYALSLAVLMAAGCAARQWQRLTAFEPDTGLVTPHAPATYCLVAVVVLAVAALFFLSRWVTKEARFSGYLAAFSTRWGATLWLYVLAGALLVAAGALGIQEHRMGLNDQVLSYVASICMCPVGVSVALTGWLNGCPDEGVGRFAWPLLVPGFGSCLWLLMGYQARASEPSVMEYVFYMLGAMCAAVCCYLIAGFSFERARPAATLWLGGLALALLAMSVTVDLLPQGRRVEALVSGGYMLYLAAQMGALLHRCHAPAKLVAWTPPQEDEAGQEDENEVTDHE